MVQSSDSSAADSAASSLPSHAHQRRREEILCRAAEVFREKGFHAAGMREIAERLGLAAGALYHYFPSKMDILHACQEMGLARLLEGGERIVRSDLPADDRLRRLVAHHLETVLDVLGGSSVHLEVGALPPERLADVVAQRDRYERMLRDLIREGVAEGVFAPVDEKVAGLALLGALNWAVAWWRPGGPRTVSELSTAFADLFLTGFCLRDGGGAGASGGGGEG